MSNELIDIEQYVNVIDITNIKQVEEELEKFRLAAEEASAKLDPSTKEGRNAIGSLARKISSGRNSLTDAVAQRTAHLRKELDEYNKTKKIIEATMNDIRLNVLAPRDEWQAEQDRLEQDRVDEIKGRISNIEEIGTVRESDTKDQISGKIDALSAMDTSDSFAEFSPDARAAKDRAIGSLNERLLRLIEIERIDAERRNMEIQKNIDAIRNTPANMIGESLDFMELVKFNIESTQLTEEDFGDRVEEARSIVEETNRKIRILIGQEREKEAAKEAERRKEEIQVNIDIIKNAPATLIGESVNSMKSLLKTIEEYTQITEENFGDRIEEARSLRAETLEKLKIMIAQEEERQKARDAAQRLRDAEEEQRIAEEQEEAQRAQKAREEAEKIAIEEKEEDQKDMSWAVLLKFTQKVRGYDTARVKAATQEEANKIAIDMIQNGSAEIIASEEIGSEEKIYEVVK